MIQNPAVSMFRQRST